ncbi:MAG: hypothetical protein KBH08_00110 [Brachymonas sp.]|nr:hypothetical protein [Brachymonas sp.]
MDESIAQIFQSGLQIAHRGTVQGDEVVLDVIALSDQRDGQAIEPGAQGNEVGARVVRLGIQDVVVLGHGGDCNRVSGKSHHKRLPDNNHYQVISSHRSTRKTADATGKTRESTGSIPANAGKQNAKSSPILRFGTDAKINACDVHGCWKNRHTELG